MQVRVLLGAPRPRRDFPASASLAAKARVVLAGFAAAVSGGWIVTRLPVGASAPVS
ncbi:hypothetical protein [Brevundimonas sp.]|uniref:hypothetical protein n=1 Tax=Brevundimonas sp. TaxID=1871086 RepID=UPI003F70AE8B